MEKPILDARNSDEIYRQALKLAKQYCPEWAKDWGDDHFDQDDPGLVIFKLFSNMAEYSNKQFNKIPEKHYMVFLDFMGIDVRPARPSMVPLTFCLAKGSKKAQIPVRTLVSSSEYPDIVFETGQHLTATALTLYAFSINPVDDGYTDHSDVLSGKRTFSIFSGDKDEKSLDHILYLGDDIFGGKTPFGQLSIKFNGTGLSPEYFEQWYNGQGLPVGIEIIRENNNSLTFNINKINTFERSIFEGIQNFWLFIKPDKKAKIIPGKELPMISNITVDIVSGNIIPEFIFFENTPLDLKTDFYPFGETPKEGNSLYICSGEGLSKENSRISLNIWLTKELETMTAELSWEYWDGSTWRELSIIQDGTNGFRKAGMCVIEFICPAIPECEISGNQGRWIRVRIKSGNFGAPGKMEQVSMDEVINSLSGSLDRKAIKSEFEKKGISFGIRYVPPTYDPPVIRSISLVYTYRDRNISQILSYNNFSYRHFNADNVDNVDTADNIVPFELFGMDGRAFYLGFEKIDATIPVSLYFSIKEKLSEKTNIKWKYHDGVAWKALSLEADETDSFNKCGIVCFLFPMEIKKSSEFGKELFWIRIEPDNQLSSIQINGIFPNTVWAFNHITVDNEILGSGNGLPGQSFSFSRKNVLPGQIIEVKDKDKPVKWMETSSFSLSGKLSRDYIIDRKDGRIFFGDGNHGMVPPKGKNNIIARSYRSGGGKKGNQEIGTLNTLRKACLDIESVTNHVPSSGGVDDEGSEMAVIRGPNTIKNSGYAVTVEDFEVLALEASPEVIRAKAFLDDTNKINVIILTDRKSETPEKNLMDSVEKHIKERAFFNIRDNIQVLRPEYKRIDTEVTVKPLMVTESSIVVEKIKKRLRAFLDPIRGGNNGTGYEFGGKIYVSRIAAAIEDVEGVDYVEEIILKKIFEENTVGEVSGGGWISIENNALPCPGNIEVRITK